MKLSLEKIADRLEALEDTIIFKLLTRAQYKENPVIYQKGQSDFVGHPNESLFDLRLAFQENLEAKFGRYSVPCEQPFNANLPLPERVFHSATPELEGEVNLTQEIKKAYFEIVKELCEAGDDGHYGSSTEHDVYALQSISERIHYGAFYVGESKFSEDEEGFRALIRSKDEAGLMAKITRAEVEERILKRIEEKTLNYQKGVNTRVRHFVEPKIIVDFYKNVIIPLTKKGEIIYLLGKK